MTGTIRAAVVCAFALGIAGFAVSAALDVSTQPPDLILVHGKILTVDAADSVVQAVAIRDGKIQAMGADKKILALAGKSSKIIDLRGRTATPGLIDSHAHIAEGGFGEVYGVALSDAASVADVVGRVKTRIAQLKPGE